MRRQLELEVRRLTLVVGAALGAGLPLVVFPSLLKQSALVCIAALSMGCLLGGWISTFAAALARGQAVPQIIIVRCSKWILAAIGLFALVFAVVDLYESIFFQHPKLLADASSLGAAGLLILGFSLQIAAAYVLVGFSLFTALAFMSWFYIRDTGLLLLNLGWNAAIAYGVILLFKIKRRKDSN